MEEIPKLLYCCEAVLSLGIPIMGYASVIVVSSFTENCAVTSACKVIFLFESKAFKTQLSYDDETVISSLLGPAGYPEKPAYHQLFVPSKAFTLKETTNKRCPNLI